MVSHTSVNCRFSSLATTNFFSRSSFKTLRSRFKRSSSSFEISILFFALISSSRFTLSISDSSLDSLDSRSSTKRRNFSYFKI